MLNILSSFMLSASCVNGLSSLDHKPSRQIEFNNVILNYEREQIPFYYQNNNDNVTSVFSNLINSNYYVMNIRSYDLSYDTDDLDVYIDDFPNTPVFYLSSAYHDFNDTYFYCLLSDYDDLSFSFDFYFLETLNDIQNYYVIVSYSFFNTIRDNKFYNVTNVYDFSQPNLVTNANNNLKYYESSFNSINNSYLNYTNGMTFDMYNITISILHSSSFDSNTIYQNGYNAGYRTGYNEGYDLGYRVGKQDGYNLGNGENGRNLFLSVADTPLLMLRSLFNFEFFGLNFFIIVVGLLTFLMILYIVRHFFKR